ncbi:MAG: tetratricopeptide repeat protein [Bacteroidia bacterium]|nr:tetratricopeptide repeat protein [Bacteroidia bacterium]
MKKLPIGKQRFANIINKNYLNKPILFILFVIFSFNAIAAQTNVIDSLMQKLQFAAEDTNKANTLLRLCREYLIINNIPEATRYNDSGLTLSWKLNFASGTALGLTYKALFLRLEGKYKEAIEQLEKSISVCKQTGDKKGIGFALNELGLIYDFLYDYPKAIAKYGDALEIWKELKDKEQIAMIYNNLGLIYTSLGNLEKALEYYQQSLKIKEELGNKDGIAASLGNIGLIYDHLENFEKAEEYYQNSFEMYKESGNKKGMANMSNNLGNIYMSLENYELALKKYMSSYSLYNDLGDKLGLAKAFNNIGLIYMEWNKYDDALKYIKKSLEIKEELRDTIGLANTLINIGDIFKKSGNYKEAIDYYNKSLHLSESINFISRIMDNYKAFSEVYSILGNSTKALEYYKLYANMKDSVYNADIHKQITEMQTKYETEKKEKEITILKWEKEVEKMKFDKEQDKLIKQRILFGFSIIILLIASFSVYIFLRNKEIKRRNSLQSELNRYMQKALLQQMNPHFIFNTINSIQYFILNNDKIASNEYLTKFASLIRIILENSEHQIITVGEDISALKLYLELEALRFDEKFDYEILLDNSDSLLKYNIPTMLIQPYVENAIWHGLLHKNGKGKITVELKKTNNSLLCRIEDNGIGRKKAMEIKQEKKQKYRAFGTALTETRLKLLNSLYACNLYINYIDLFDDSGNAAGTKVEISIPIIS